VIARAKDGERFSWWRWLIKQHPVLAALLAAVLVAAVVVGVVKLWPTTQPPLLVTDGQPVINAQLADIEGLIKTENDWVTTQSHQPYVTIAVVDTLNPVSNVDSTDATALRHQFEGAYLAQYEHNHAGGKPQLPLVRMVIGDEGSQASSWQALATDLERRADSGEHLVAVTDLGVSIANTLSLVNELANHHIAMVAATITAGEYSGIPGLVRIGPTNHDEAVAALKYLDGLVAAGTLPPKPRVVIVGDHDSSDTYALSLSKAFADQLASEPDRYDQSKDPGFNAQYANAGTTLKQDADRMCAVDVLYFAGRSNDLKGFLPELANRNCPAPLRSLTVVSGDTASLLANPDSNSPLWNGYGGKAKLTVNFTALAHPDLWTKNPDTAGRGAQFVFTDKCANCFNTRFPAENLSGARPLDDGGAIMNYDAALTAITAAQNAASVDNPVPSTKLVAGALPQVSVAGASGYLCFDNGSDPTHKAIPVLAIDSFGRTTYVSVSSDSPDGNPQIGPCQR
jgi:hypothetical protein